MRPRSITIFHRLMIPVMVVNLVQRAMSWNAALSFLQADPATTMFANRWFLLGANLLNFGIYALVWYKIVARASNGARWTFLALTILNLVGITINHAASGYASIAPATAITALLQVVALACLFLPDAKHWFAHKGTITDPLVF